MKTDKEFLESLREKEAVYLRKRAGRRKAAGFAAGGLLLAGIVIGVGAFAGKKPAIPEEGTPKVAELPSASQPATIPVARPMPKRGQ